MILADASPVGEEESLSSREDPLPSLNCPQERELAQVVVMSGQSPHTGSPHVPSYEEASERHECSGEDRGDKLGMQVTKCCVQGCLAHLWYDTTVHPVHLPSHGGELLHDSEALLSVLAW